MKLEGLVVPSYIFSCIEVVNNGHRFYKLNHVINPFLIFYSDVYGRAILFLQKCLSSRTGRHAEICIFNAVYPYCSAFAAEA
jgi:hypothetical protein